MNNGMIELGAEKMSKSIGNIVSFRKALDRWGREAILVFFLGAYYRSPIEYSDVTMQAARGIGTDAISGTHAVGTFQSQMQLDSPWPRLRARLSPTMRPGPSNLENSPAPCCSCQSRGNQLPRHAIAWAIWSVAWSKRRRCSCASNCCVWSTESCS